MSRLFLTFVVLLTLSACTDDQKIPKDIIGKTKMESILWDMVKADRFVNGFVIKPNDSVYRKQEVATVYAQVFKVHGITQEQFLKSYKFYLSRPDITKVLFDSIAAKSERRRAELYQPNKRDSVPPRVDSLIRKRSLMVPRKK